MSIVSILFIFFVLLTMIIYYLTPSKFRYLVLLAASLVFLFSYGLQHVPFVMANLVTTYVGARLLSKSDNKHRKLVLILTLTISFGLLCYTKYTNFFLQSLNALIKFHQFDMLNLILPLGISFYTFMSVGYVLDIYWKRYDAEKNFFKYATFLLFFPHIMQGPIDRYNKFAPQMNNPPAFDYERFVSGAELILWGLFLKLVMSNQLGVLVNTVYSDIRGYSGIVWWVTIIFYSIQTYADFLGCMEIASGVSELFGIKIERNFNHPYFSKTIPEFWRRWHISLGLWFKDYLFLPLSNSAFVRIISQSLGKKFGPNARRNFVSCFSTAVVWLATGLWHGAGWRFVAWGTFYGSMIIAGILFNKPIKKLTTVLHINTKAKSWELFQMARTFILCCIGRVFFRSPSLREGLFILKQMFGRIEIWKLVDGSLFTLGLERPHFCLMIICILILWIVSMLQERFQIRQKFAEQNIVFRWIVLYVAIFAVIIFGVYGPGYDASTFIYEQF